MIRCLFIFMLSFISAGCLAVDDNKDRSSCTEVSLDELYSSYTVSDAVKYGGGLTTESFAKDRIGKKAIVERETFKIRDFVIFNPSYELACYPLPSEGEVDVNRWSNFYGFGSDRASIKVLHVYDEDDVAGAPSVSLELVGGQLWEMYDGWIYKMKPL